LDEMDLFMCCGTSKAFSRWRSHGKLITHQTNRNDLNCFSPSSEQQIKMVSGFCRPSRRVHRFGKPREEFCGLFSDLDGWFGALPLLWKFRESLELSMKNEPGSD
jgi:hypothetical protein